MSIKDSFLTILRHALAAATFLLLLAVGMEWFLPGSTLPLLNSITPLPFFLLATIVVFLGAKRKKGFINLLQVVFGLVVSGGLLAILALGMPNYGLRSWILIVAVGIAIGVWAIAYSVQQD